MKNENTEKSTSGIEVSPLAIEDLKCRNASLSAANARMVVFYDAVSRLHTSRTSENCADGQRPDYREVLRDVMKITDARYGAFGIFNAAGDLSEFISEGMTEDEIERIGAHPTGKGLLSACYHEKTTTRVEDISTDPRRCGYPAGHPPIKSLIALPLLAAGVTRGVIYLGDKQDGGAFTEDDEAILNLYGGEMERAIERDDFLERLADSNNQLQAEKQAQQELIKQLKDAQAQLLQSEKLAAIGQLAAGVAHEINNPVGYISSNLVTLQDYVADLLRLLQAYELAVIDDEAPPRRLARDIDIDYLKEDIPSLVTECQEGANRVRQIVQDLKSFSHVDETTWQWADLHRGLDGTLNIVHNEIKYKAEVIREYGSIPEVECMPSQINQVFMNFLVNAAQAIRQHGTITIRTGAQNDWVWVEISDTGGGISPDNVKRIFEPFFTTKPVGKGTGLGLSLSFGIVKKHKGRIEVESHLGEGTTFKVWLPVQQDKGDGDYLDEGISDVNVSVRVS